MTTVESTESSGRRPRGTYAKTEERRRLILDAALEVFAESGYRSGSLRDIADNVGMSEAGLLHHFPNKSALLAAVLERRDQHSLEFVPIDTLEPREILRGLVWLAGYNASVPGVVELYCTLSAEATSPDHPAHGYFVQRYATVRERLVRSWRALAEAGDLRENISPESAARNTLAIMDGLQVQWLLDRTSMDMAEELALFFQGLVTFELGDLSNWTSGVPR